MNINLNKIIEQESVKTLFQPIVSTRKRSVSGFEALSRGIDTHGNIIPPVKLFSHATCPESRLSLDRICRKKALEAFSIFRKHNQGGFISINIDSSIISTTDKSDHLLRCANEFSVPYSEIVIEILESDIEDMEKLADFVERYRRRGFIIAIDDIGSGFSNQERIISLRPDILKIDRSLITGINNNFFKQEVVKSLISMGHGIGSIIIAEGIEDEEEAITSMALGADLLQGFYFSKPVLPELFNYETIYSKINNTANRFREFMLSSVECKRSRFGSYDKIVNNIIDCLSKTNYPNIDKTIESFVEKNPVIECAYIIGDDGLQITDTIINRKSAVKMNRLFQPDNKMTNQSHKSYFFYLKSGLSKFTSDPYISSATGNLCITISSSFKTNEGIPLILCIDFREEEINNFNSTATLRVV